ncbi:Bcr/CflA family efflux MFS transporter [Emticicia sp. CRIBPO]|uniref:multidrug effflux MFS transporter n=1 Tax=Emticicia sp. CRIBPO TaxID=2683258 RepID=UPI00141316BB|nr:multidrug effflux MFS transporter [Emticicia sp. CRIBPO]NBA84640.1 Bcr/CflA family efflux MFS transporter [Emticicia sp. CRIBPO]
MIETRKKYYQLIILLGVLSALMPLSIDMYLPGFPAIARSLHTDVAAVGVSLAGFFVGVCAGQLFYGPLMDKFGRKKPLIFGLSLYLLASLACLFATHVEQFVGFRFLQAFGGCAGFVANRAIARDLFAKEEIVKVFSMLVLVMGIAPIVAPTLGSFIVTTLNWQAIFALLAVISLFLVLSVIFFLPETKQPDKSFSLHPKAVLKEYAEVLGNKRFILYTIAFSSASAGMFAYITGSPSLFMHKFGLTEQQFGMIFGLNASCYILGSQVNRLVIKWRTSEQLVIILGSLLFLVALILAALTYYGLDSFPAIFTCLAFFLLFTGIINPNLNALSLEPFTRNIGVASALSGFLQMGINALSSFTVSYFSDGTSTSMVAVILFFASLSLCCLSYRSLELSPLRSQDS